MTYSINLFHGKSIKNILMLRSVNGGTHWVSTNLHFSFKATVTLKILMFLDSIFKNKVPHQRKSLKLNMMLIKIRKR